MPKYEVTRVRRETYLADVANAEQAIEVAFHEDNTEFWVPVEDLDVDVHETGPGDPDIAAENEREVLEALIGGLMDVVYQIEIHDVDTWPRALSTYHRTEEAAWAYVADLIRESYLEMEGESLRYTLDESLNLHRDAWGATFDVRMLTPADNEEG